jgi:hypothetical protein
MNTYFNNIISQATGASSIYEIEEIQSLWSGYGKILRIGLVGSKYKSVVVKYIQSGEVNSHPRGWDTDFSHQRKVKSYEVESEWYLNWSSRCNQGCRVPKCFIVESFENEVIIILEDLTETQFCETRVAASPIEIQACLNWLAGFHALFMKEDPGNLWEQGTYWHLNTRPDELAKMKDSPLKENAFLIDEKLYKSSFKTIVHGDAKLANFCFTKDGYRSAAVDFQYVGGGCGMKDVAYFLGGCLTEEEFDSQVRVYLDFYFNALAQNLDNGKFYFQDIESEWRELFPFAWADFQRFLKGWSPSHWKINDYSERITREVVESFEQK